MFLKHGRLSVSQSCVWAVAAMGLRERSRKDKREQGSGEIDGHAVRNPAEARYNRCLSRYTTSLLTFPVRSVFCSWTINVTFTHMVCQNRCHRYDHNE